MKRRLFVLERSDKTLHIKYNIQECNDWNRCGGDSITCSMYSLIVDDHVNVADRNTRYKPLSVCNKKMYLVHLHFKYDDQRFFPWKLVLLLLGQHMSVMKEYTWRSVLLYNISIFWPSRTENLPRIRLVNRVVDTQKECEVSSLDAGLS